ncbi:MAG: hypothetical protein KF816_06235 [Melioribacteraceae bacterium]|nr:hypothetical protein [Melioribacteraceae bacterium]
MDQIIKIIIVILVANILITVILGGSKKFVFYYDFKDLFISFLSCFVLLIGIILSSYLDLKEFNLIAVTISIMIGIYSLYLAVKYNRMNILVGIPIGISKIILGGLFVLKLFDLISPSGKSVGNRRESRMTSGIILFLLSIIFKFLINGEEVYQKNGWDIPK